MAGNLLSAHPDLEKQSVAVTVCGPFDNCHHVSAGIALVPILFSAATPENHFAAVDRATERLLVHPGEHQDVTLVRILDDCRGEHLVSAGNGKLDAFKNFFLVHIKPLA